MSQSRCCRYRYPYLPLTSAFFGTSVITTTQPFAGSARRSSNFSAANRIQSARPVQLHEPPRHSPARACGMSMAQPISPSSSDQINRARPGLVAVALRHAHIARKIGAARERHDVIDDEAPAPILLGHLNMGRRARSPCAILVWLEALERPVQNISGLPQGLAGISVAGLRCRKTERTGRSAG